MKIACIGGGPASLYFGILRKKLHPEDEITIFERNAAEVTFGWGVVFSDETLGYLGEHDEPTYRAITYRFAHWDEIAIHFGGECIRSKGHGFSGIARRDLLSILQGRCRELGVRLVFEEEIQSVAPLASTYDLVVAADGVRSLIRTELSDAFRPTVQPRKCKYIWLGADLRFEAFTFLFERNAHGLFQAHAYPFDDARSTFIVECTEATWRAAGLDTASEEESAAYLEKVFAPHLKGRRLLVNKSQWIQFPHLRNESWHHRNVVLLGDAAHTAHFSIGSGTKLAMEDSIALVKALEENPGVSEALAAYERERRPMVERLQKTALDSLAFFETTEDHERQEPLEFAFNLLTRSKRIGYENLKKRDPALVERVTRRFAEKALEAAKGPHGDLPLVSASEAPLPPMFTPYRLRDMTLVNRVVVSPMCMYSAVDGVPGDFHLVHLGARALGGAGLVFTEMTNVSPEGRITLGCTGMYTPAHRDAWKRIVDFVHGNSRAKIALQLGHAGRKGSTPRPWEGDAPALAEGGYGVIAPSSLPYRAGSPLPKAMDRSDMDRVRDAFVQAALWADEAGFDMIEMHAAHGYLLASFLSPLTNLRNDEYGGSVHGRLRYPLEVFDALRTVWPKSKPMSVRISASDWAPGGLSEEDMLVIAQAFREHGCDILDVSTGQTVPEARPVYGRMWQTPFSERIRHAVGIPTLTVGNITTGEQINTILAGGRADLCALARPHLDDPHFTLHAAKEQAFEGAFWPPPYAMGKTVVVAAKG